jgi:hypothetical protein
VHKTRGTYICDQSLSLSAMAAQPARSALTMQLKEYSSKAYARPMRTFAWLFMSVTLYMNALPYPPMVAELRREVLAWLVAGPSSSDDKRALGVLQATTNACVPSASGLSSRTIDERVMELVEAYAVASRDHPGFLESGHVPPVLAFLKLSNGLLRFVIEVSKKTVNVDRLKIALVLGRARSSPAILLPPKKTAIVVPSKRITFKRTDLPKSYITRHTELRNSLDASWLLHDESFDDIFTLTL